MAAGGSDEELVNSDGLLAGQTPLRVDEGQVQQDYKNLYWTRIIRVENYEPLNNLEAADHRYRWPLAPDIIEHCNAVADLPEADPDSWAPLF